jgi:hypothetical protein
MTVATPTYVGARVAALQDGEPPLRQAGPRWMRVALVLLGVVVVLWAVATITDVSSRASALDRVAYVDVPVATDLAATITELSEADQQAAGVMLGSGAQREDGVRAVQANIAAAQQALIRVNSARPDLRDLIAQAQRDVTTYGTTVNAALDAQRLGPSPSGVANLRSASYQLRFSYLPPLQVKLGDLRAAETAPALANAAAAPWNVVGTGVLAFVVLVGVQWHLAVRSRRRLNAGLVVATLLLVAGTATAVGAADRTADAAGPDGAAGRLTAADVAVSSAIDARQAYDDEIVWFGEDGTGATGDEAGSRFDGALSRIESRAAPGDQVRLMITAWRDAHRAVEATLGSPDPQGLGRASILGIGPGSGEAFNGLAAALDDRVRVARADAGESLDRAGAPLDGLVVVTVVLAIVIVGSAALGLRARMRDYR